MKACQKELFAEKKSVTNAKSNKNQVENSSNKLLFN